VETPETFPPEDLSRHPGHLIRRAQQVLNLVWSEEVSKTTTSPQFAVLNALLLEPNIDQRTLGDRVALDRSTVAEIVARLTARRLVRWNRNAKDGRRKTIQLTRTGERTLQELIPRTHRMTHRLVSALQPEEQAELTRLLTRIVHAHEGRQED
jgi:MarR family transcriptional regulator, temperature-dependent positive regulator of motility